MRPVGAQEWNIRFVQWLDDKPSDYRGLFTRAIASRIDLFISFNVNSFVHHLEHSRDRVFLQKNSSCYLSKSSHNMCMYIYIVYIYIYIYVNMKVCVYRYMRVKRCISGNYRKKLSPYEKLGDINIHIIECTVAQR